MRTRNFIEREREKIPAKEYMTVIYDSQTLMQFRGKLATFLVGATSRQNASWQGQVTWADKNITKNFRSTLELIKLMDGAITSEETKNS